MAVDLFTCTCNRRPWVRPARGGVDFTIDFSDTLREPQTSFCGLADGWDREVILAPTELEGARGRGVDGGGDSGGGYAGAGPGVGVGVGVVTRTVTPGIGAPF